MGVNSYAVDTSKVLLDYPAIPGGSLVLPSSTKISNGTTRANSKPVTYRLIITPSGLLSFMYSYNGGAYNSVLTNFPITTSNGPLPSTLRFGFAGSTGGSTNVHEISCFVAEPVQSTSSIGANTVQSGQVRTGTQVYLASYNPNGWMGSLVSDAIVNTAGTLSVSSVSNWDANCVLTGGACPNTGVAITTAEAPTYSTTSRQLLTWNGSAGVPLEWANLTSAQQTVLSPDSTTMGQYRLNWLRGDRSQEQTLAGPLRTRGGVLGDIVDSSPLWVGPPSAGYVSPFKDSLYVSTGSETSYATYSSSMATRMNVVYAGSNDGLLHGFRTGSNNTDGTYNSTNNDGYEVIGFMPSTVLADSNVVSLTSPTYGHNYFVDAPPGTGDLFYNGAWHTWLVGGIGPGGAEIFALDVTDPTGSVTATSAFKETNAANLVMGDWTSASLTTLTCVHAVTNCGNNLFDTYGTPLIRRLHNGKWAIIFGNGLPVSIAGLAWSGNVLTVTTSSNHGYAVGSTVTIGGGVTDSNSIPVNGSRTITSVPTPTTFTVALTSNPGTFSNVSSGVTALTSNSNHAGVFIGLISSTTGTVSSFYWLDTGIGSDSSPDGIAYVSSADLDGDRVTDYLYAGDLLGNVWRFDLTSSNPADWGVSNFGHTSATPLFVAKDSGGTAQPITTKIAVTGTTTGNKLRVILGFGTGLATPFTTASGVTYSSGQQTVYGIWDWDMTLWNNGTTTTGGVVIPGSSSKYAPLAEVRSTGPTVYQTTLLTRTNLLANTRTQTATTRTMAISNVSWCGSSTCSSPNNQYGWYFDLPDTVASTSCGGTTCYEQIIYSPVFSGGDLLINSTIPATATVAQCTPSLPTGWTVAFNMASGGGFVQNVFPDTTGSLTVTTGNNSIVGLKLSGVGTPYVVSVGSKQYVVNPNSGGGVNMKQINTQNGVTVKRISWTELR
jgi:type IV pilus assembly protein PilY1